MPEETNRLLTDQIADLLFTPSADADENLGREGIPECKLHRVGNVMIDSLVRLLPEAIKANHTDLPDQYGLVTLHRPSNVDDEQTLKSVLGSLREVNAQLSVVFPVHPRTRRHIGDFGSHAPNLRLLDPLPYIEFLVLQRKATVVITDSGGIQEETTFLGIPCLTLRENTERPITVTAGTNILVGQDREKLRQELCRVLQGRGKKGRVPPLWDGHAAERIAGIIAGLDAARESA